MKFTLLMNVLLAIMTLQSYKNSTGSHDVVKKIDSRAKSHRDHQINRYDIQPDSARFASLEDEPGIYDGDSEFGVGVSNTITDLSKK